MKRPPNREPMEPGALGACMLYGALGFLCFLACLIIGVTLIGR